jgi:hypothetical protein
MNWNFVVFVMMLKCPRNLALLRNVPLFCKDRNCGKSFSKKQTMNQKKKQRSPEQIIKLYDWLWARAVKGKEMPFDQLKPTTWTGRAIYLVMPQRLQLRKAMKSQAYRDAVTKIIHSN